MTVTLVERRPCDVKGYLILNSFAGGDKGRCVQLTTPEDYVQMTFDDARSFFREAITKIDEIENQFNECPPWWERLQPSGESTQ